MIPDLTPAEIERFYSKLHVGGCGVLWAGSDVHPFGYGQFAIYRGGRRKRILAHRLAYKLATGEDPGPLVVRHRCDTPPCCTTDCFLLGTQADNVRDAIERHRLDSEGLAAYRAARDAGALLRLETHQKACSRCWQTKRLEDFHRAARNVDGRAYWCKDCRLDYQREHRDGLSLSERERRRLKRQAA